MYCGSFGYAETQAVVSWLPDCLITLLLSASGIGWFPKILHSLRHVWQVNTLFLVLIALGDSALEAVYQAEVVDRYPRANWPDTPLPPLAQVSVATFYEILNTPVLCASWCSFAAQFTASIVFWVCFNWWWWRAAIWHVFDNIWIVASGTACADISGEGKS